MNKVYLFDELMRDDVSLLGRAKFLEKYGNNMEGYYDKIAGQKIRKILVDSLKSIREDKLNTMKRITVKEWRKMGKVKAWLMDMEEDATHMDKDAWVRKHGQAREYIFDKVQDELSEVQGTLDLTKS